MLALYVNFALLCLVSSVLGRPARLTGTTNTRIEQDESTDDDVWEPLYDGHKTYLSDMERENPGLLEDQATNGQRTSDTISLRPMSSHLKQILILWSLHALTVGQYSALSAQRPVIFFPECSRIINMIGLRQK